MTVRFRCVARGRTADRAAKVTVSAYELFASSEFLGELALERMMAKLLTRRYRAGLEPVGSAVEATPRGIGSFVTSNLIAGAVRRIVTVPGRLRARRGTLRGRRIPDLP